MQYASKSQFPLFTKVVKLEVGYRIDILAEESVVIEVKSVDALAPIHEAQLLMYLRLSGKSLGLLLNFNSVHMKDGIRRFVMGTDWK